MKFLANENIPLASILVLTKSGYNIKSIAAECPGITDKEVISLSNLEARTILTFDRDYGELIFKFGYRPVNGVILLRWKIFLPAEPGKFLADFFTTKTIDFENTFTVINETSIRQRKY